MFNLFKKKQVKTYAVIIDYDEHNKPIYQFLPRKDIEYINYYFDYENNKYKVNVCYSSMRRIIKGESLFFATENYIENIVKK